MIVLVFFRMFQTPSKVCFDPLKPYGDVSDLTIIDTECDTSVYASAYSEPGKQIRPGTCEQSAGILFRIYRCVIKLKIMLKNASQSTMCHSKPLKEAFETCSWAVDKMSPVFDRWLDELEQMFPFQSEAVTASSGKAIVSHQVAH